MKRPFLLTAPLLFAVAAALLAASPARAQIQAEDWNITIQGPKLKQGTNQIVPATLNNAVAALRRLYPEENIVLEPGVGQIMIGDVVLHCTEPGNDLEAFSIASGRAFILEKHLSTVEPRGNSPFDRGVPTNALLVIKANKLSPDAKTEKKVAAFNLSGYLSKQVGVSTNEAQHQKEIEGRVERLQDIINRTLAALHPRPGGVEKFPYPGAPRFEFYPDANLLIVIGSVEDLEAARVVISALPGMVEDKGGGGAIQTPFLPVAPPPLQNNPP